MTIKFEELAKASSSHFKKLGEHHSQMAKAYGEHQSFLKGKVAAMDDSHDMHSVVAKSAGHAEAMENCHKAAAAHCEECAKSIVVEITKAFSAAVEAGAAAGAAAAAAAPAAAEVAKCAHEKSMTDACGDCKREKSAPAMDGVTAMIEETKNALVKKALESMTGDSDVANAIKEMVLKGVRESLGDKTVPTMIRNFGQPNTPSTVKAVPRTGQPAIDTKGIPAEFESLVEL